uniref:CW domain-containing protein n=2 Tax=Caenorhabditis tropicalis TaxID=1561998 RepID=A0A1I7UIL5_9PELO
MVKIFGRVENFNLESSEVNEDCVTDCFEANDCFLGFMDSDNHCLLFNFNDTEQLTVSETGPEDKLVVAFKANISINPSSPSCPSYSDLNLTVTLPNGDQIIWEKEGNQFEFKKCIGNWKMFKRSEDLTVCMQTFNVTSPSMKTVEDTRKSCNDLGGYKLIGVASYEELLWIKQKHDAAKYVGYAGYWVDGKREEVSSGMINTNFEFSDGLTVLNKTLYDEYAVISGLGQNRRTPEDCLTVCQPGGDRLMNDVMCDTSGSGYGFVCGYQLV